MAAEPVTHGFSCSWEIQPGTLPGELQVLLRGKFTYPDLPAFRAFAEGLTTQECTIVHINLRELSFVDSSALGTFVWLHRKLDEHAKQLKFSEPSWKVMQVLKATRLDNFLNFVQ